MIRASKGNSKLCIFNIHDLTLVRFPYSYKSLFGTNMNQVLRFNDIEQHQNCLKSDFKPYNQRLYRLALNVVVSKISH